MLIYSRVVRIFSPNLMIQVAIAVKKVRHACS
jgi:hypothetical protein